MSGPPVLGDWGSTRLRLWRMAEAKVADRREGPGIFAAPDRAAALLDALGDWPGDRLMLCGMAGAREGLHEVPYLPCPISANQWASGTADIALGEWRVSIAAGLSCRTLQGRSDVMRGEEAQVFGALTLDPALAAGTHWLLLPGTHSKWVRVKDGSITGFRTFMTGELFALLERSSLAVAGSAAGNDNEPGFSAGLDRTLEGGGLSGNLFEARSAQLVEGRSGDWGRGFLSGLLVGTEVAELAPQGLVTVIGAPELSGRYAEALARHGAEARPMDGEACAIAGLRLLDEN